MISYNSVYQNVYRQISAIVCGKYSYDNNQAFKKESNFGIKLPIRSCYAWKQVNQEIKFR